MESGGRVRWSPDGAYWWSGAEWIPTVSPDQAWRWNGSRWLPLPVPLPKPHRGLHVTDWPAQAVAAAATVVIVLLAQAVYDPILPTGWVVHALAVMLQGALLLLWLAIVGAVIMAWRRQGPLQMRRLALLPAVAACLWPCSSITPSAESNWVESRAAFDRYVESIQPPPAAADDEWMPIEAPGRIGKYNVVDASQIGDAVILYVDTPFETHLLALRGYAHMPSGPGLALTSESGLFGIPQFTHIEGAWYRWQAFD